LFANKSAQVAVLSLVAPTDLLRPRQLHVDRYDLSNGQALGGLDLQGVTKQEVQGVTRHGPIEIAGDLSPDGEALAVIDPQEEKRVDIWNLATGKPQVSFQPLRAGEDSKVRFAAFLPEKRFLTITKAGKLTVWSIPDCKAIYSGDGYQGTQALSPGRKYLAASGDSGIVILETATGELRGQLTLSTGSVPANTFALAFNTESTTLVGVLSKASNGVTLARWQLGKQSPNGSFYGLPHLGRSVQCCGEEYVLVDNQLFDLNLQALVGIYSLPGMGRGGFEGPDGRFWFAVAGRNQSNAVLAAQTLPDAQTRQYLMALSQPGTKKLLGPGAAITVQVQLLGAAPKAEELRGQVVQGLNQRLKSLSFTPEEGQALTLKVQFQEKATGKTMEYKEILGGRGGKIIVQIKQVECQAVLTGPDGVLWQAKTTFQTPERNVIQGNDFQGILDQQMWTQASGWTSSLTIPSMLVKVGNKLEGLPHTFVLTGDQ
jgi:hypothetical protein